MKRKSRNQSGITFRHNPPRLIAFGAVSSGAQATDDKASLSEQFRVIQDYAAANGFAVIDRIEIPGFSRDFYTYADFCEAAALEGITAPQRMATHWQEQDFDIVAVLNFSRLGREEGIIHDFVGRTYGCGALVYTQKNGLIAPENRRVVTMIEAYGSKSEVDEITRRRDMGMRRRAELGLPVGPHVPHFHRLTFNERGEEIRTPGADGKLYYLTVNRTQQRLFDDLYDLMVNHHTVYDALEREMAARGHFDKAGRRYYYRFFADKVWLCAFHGAMGYGDLPRRQRWLIDPAYAADIPDGTIVHYGVVEPVYLGEAGVMFRQELYRRQEIRGNAKPGRLHRFTGLLLCAVCGYPIGFHRPTQRDAYYRCHSHWLVERRAGRSACDQTMVIRESDVQAFLDPLLRRMLSNTGDVAAFTEHYYNRTVQPAPQIEAELARAIASRDRLVMRLRDDRMPDTALASVYKALDDLGTQIEALERQISAQQQQDAAAHNRAVLLRNAAAEINLDVLWLQDDTTINHALHRILDPMRVQCLDGQPVQLVWGGLTGYSKIRYRDNKDRNRSRYDYAK